MKSKLEIFLFLIFVSTTSRYNYAQVLDSTRYPKISIISANAFFIDTVVSQSNSQIIPGTFISLPVVTIYKFLEYEFNISFIIRDKGQRNQLPLKVRLINPNEESQFILINQNIADMQQNIIYNYRLNISTNVSGWFNIELISDEEENNKIIVFDKTQTRF